MMEFFLSLLCSFYFLWIWTITMRQRELKLEIDMYLKEIEQCIKFTTSSGIVLDLETNLGCFENTEGMSSHWNFFKLEFNDRIELRFRHLRSFESKLTPVFLSKIDNGLVRS
jgi:hypothetical protein